MNTSALSASAELVTSLATQPDTREIELRHSMLKQIAKSPAHCYHAMVSGYDDQTLSKRLGSAVHSLLLGGPRVVLYPSRRAGKDYEKFAADNKDAIICSRAEYDRAHRINDSVRGDVRASRILFAPGAVYETTIRWEWLGRKRRTTPDARDFTFLAEVKTTRNASPEKFRWDVIRYAYHAQLADQSLAIETNTGRAPREVFCIAIETLPPFVPVVYRLTPNDLEQGARLNRAWMERFLLSEATGDWPGYASAIVDLDLPDPDGDATFPMDVDDIEPSDIDLSAEE